MLELWCATALRGGGLGPRSLDAPATAWSDFKAARQAEPDAADVERVSFDLVTKHVGLGLGHAFWRGVVRPFVARETRLRERLDIRTAEREEALRQLAEMRATRPRIDDPIVRKVVQRPGE